MDFNCTSPCCQNAPRSKSRRWIRNGDFYRKSDYQRVQRWRCSRCGKSISRATTSSVYRQKKPYVNEVINVLLCSSVSQRRIAMILGINRKTVARKFQFLAQEKRKSHERFLKHHESNPFEHVQFDEMETYEHSKWKPLSIPLMVSEKRKILGFHLAEMPAHGKHAAKARAKYGPRKDQRSTKTHELFERVKPALKENVEVFSDQKVTYPKLIRKSFPHAKHRSFKGRKATIAGQGELKEGRNDPLFPLNHTAAMFRANMNRLVRSTWCTTKKRERLEDHLYLYTVFHNEILNGKGLITDLIGAHKKRGQFNREAPRMHRSR